MMTMGGALANAPLPLDVLLEAMRIKWSEGHVNEAVALAKAAAPFVHAKPTYSKGGVLNLSALSDERLDELCALVSTGTHAEDEASG